MALEYCLTDHGMELEPGVLLSQVFDRTTTPVVLVESEKLVPIFVPSQSYRVSDIVIRAPLLTHHAFALEWRSSYLKAGDLYLYVPCVDFWQQFWNKNVGDAFNSNATA